MTDDSRLNRLLDYTKFHVGIYLSFGGGLIALIGASNSPEKFSYLLSFIGSPWALYISLIFMAVAGLAGGIVASSCTQYSSWNDLWEGKQGPFGWKWLSGKRWASIEHACFWISLGFITYAVLSSMAAKTIVNS